MDAAAGEDPDDGLGPRGGRISDHDLPLGFLMKDVRLLVVSFYQLKRDLTRAVLEMTRT